MAVCRASVSPAGFRAGLLLPLLALIAACTQQPASPPPAPPAAVSPRPVAKPAAIEQAALRKARAERNRALNTAADQAQAEAGPVSLLQRDFYAQAEQRLLERGLLRRDHAPQDAPFDADARARNFLAIALRDEYSRQGDRLVPGGAPAPLRRWQAPVALQLEFGASVDAATRSTYRSEVAAYATRLSQASGHPVTLTPIGGNFIVLVLNDDERTDIGPRLAELIPGIPPGDVQMIRDLDKGNYCTVFAYSRGAAADYAHAVALLRTELPPLLRRSCIHEELAQGMGLANDSPAARPSIFNDDEEFALLTRHDELLLRILYDPRLRPGMSEAEAAPVVHRIAAELLGEET